MKNVLITGATGFVGSNIAKTLLKMDLNIIGLHVDSLNPTRLQFQGIDKGIQWVNGALEDFEFLQRVINMYEIDTIFHMAAVSIVRIASRQPTVTFRTNIMGTWNLLEAARLSKTITAFVGASSDKAYGIHEDLPYREDFALNANNSYEASKACEDILIRTYAHNYGLPAVVTRACNIYGPGDFNYSRIVPNSVRKLLNNESPIIWKGVNEYIREFVYVDDLVMANILLASKAEELKGEAFNITCGDMWKVEDMVNFIAEVMNKPIRVSVVEKELEFLEIPKQYLDGSKLRALGWDNCFTIKGSGMENTVKWYKSVFESGVK